MRIIKGYVAEVILKYLLRKYESTDYEGRCFEFAVTGYFKEGDTYTCFDNTGYCCFVEQAKTETEAIKWCMKEIEVEKLYFGS